MPGLPAATIRKIKDLKVISLAMRRQKNLKEESRTHYCSGVLYDNIGNQRQAIDEYEKFLRIALFLQDRCSIELVLNSIGIAYMALQDYTSNSSITQPQSTTTANKLNWLRLRQTNSSGKSTQGSVGKSLRTSNRPSILTNKRMRWRKRVGLGGSWPKSSSRVFS